MTKTIDTLVDDIYTVLKDGIDMSDAQAKEFGKRMETMIKTRLAPRKERPFTLRMSSIGKPVNQLWYEAHGYEKEDFKPNTLMKFLYGDMVEELALFLAEVAGHEVTDMQKEVQVDGIKGHMDCKIDGVVMDVKSTSGRGFDKFKYNKLKTDDPFGYMHQISGYAHAEDETKGGFFAINKDQGHICTSIYEGDELEDVPSRITYIKDTLAKDEPPSKMGCMQTRTEKNGNEFLAAKCTYCPFMKDCHKGLRTFLYSTGPRHFTKIVKEPRVKELTEEKNSAEVSK